MNYCDCGDYCQWCHPELCAPVELVPVWIFGRDGRCWLEYMVMAVRYPEPLEVPLSA